MKVRAVFFASYRDAAGTGERWVELPADARAGDLVQELRAADPRLQSLPERPALAVNMRYAALSAPLADGDEVAFIPPVAGG